MALDKDWVIDSLKDQLATRGGIIATMKVTIASQEEIIKLKEDFIARLEAEIEKGKYERAQQQAAASQPNGARPANKRASAKPHPFKMIPGGKTEQDSPGDRAEHS